MPRTSGILLNKSNKKNFRKNGLEIFDHKYNESNGGSSRYYIKHKENKKLK